MFLPEEETEQIPQISIIFIVSFSALLLLGCLSMTFANFDLGAVLFALGLVLVAGNEYMLLRRHRIMSRSAAIPVSSDIEGLILFSLAASPTAAIVGYLHYMFYGWSEKVLLAVASGFLASAVKIASVSLQLLLPKR